MTFKNVKYFFLLTAVLCFQTTAHSQVNTPLRENLKLHFDKSPGKKTYFSNQNSSSSVLPISIGFVTIIYLINPILIYEDKKIYAGFTKEISVGWGKFGEHRTAFEYSLILGGNVRHFLRFSYKYDILLKSGIEPSHMMQGTPVLSVGAGYFNDFKGGGVFPELSYGYSVRNHKFLFYAHIKLRHTFMLDKLKPDITDLSLGIMIGIANPFIDVDIRRKY